MKFLTSNFSYTNILLDVRFMLELTAVDLNEKVKKFVHEKRFALNL